MSRSHKRTVRKNEDVGMDILNQPFITPEKVVLYDRYVKSKHRESTVEESAEALNVLLNIHYGYPHTIEMDYFREGQLIGVGIVDEGRDALSSNYFYYDTDYLDRRLGVFSILKEIELAKILGKKYYYLGFFIEENPKMSYKKYFRPNETLKNGVWRDFLK
jgi:arginine-tRNA-protein transferase